MNPYTVHPRGDGWCVHAPSGRIVPHTYSHILQRAAGIADYLNILNTTETSHA